MVGYCHMLSESFGNEHKHGWLSDVWVFLYEAEKLVSNDKFVVGQEVVAWAYTNYHAGWVLLKGLWKWFGR